MLRLDASALDYSILAVYFLVVLGIGAVARLSIKTDIDFFLSGRSLPAWITGLAFIAANLGALEILGMAANGAQYGVATVHFYWIGAVPAMVFLGLVMMPFYYGAKVRSVPEYLRLRFNDATHALNAATFAVGTVLIAGVNLFALALVVHLMLGWSISIAILVAAAIVLFYITLGGLTSAIYNEVLQFFIILASLVPLTLIALESVGGVHGLADKVRGSAAQGAGAARLGGTGHRQRQLHRRQLDRDRDGPGLRALLRLLDHELRRGPAGALGAQPLGGPAHAADRRLPEDLHPRADDHPGPGRAGQRQGPGGRPRTSSTTRRSRADRQVDARGDAGPGRDRPARRLHGGSGGQRDRLQHGGDLRHLAGLRRARTATTPTTCGSAGSRPWWGS